MGIAEDDIPTRRIQKLAWLPPVASVEQLPVDGVADGTMCFVEAGDDAGGDEVWEFRDGRWSRVDTL